jgi:hypothetical protein
MIRTGFPIKRLNDTTVMITTLDQSGAFLRSRGHSLQTLYNDFTLEHSPIAKGSVSLYVKSPKA